MFSMCSEFTPRARILDTRIPQLMQPCAYGRKGGTIKLENLHRVQSEPALEKTPKQFFDSRPLHGANISQIFSFTKTTDPHNIQLLHGSSNLCIGAQCTVIFVYQKNLSKAKF